MIAHKDTEPRQLNLHCEMHDLALRFGEGAVRAVSTALALVTCPGKDDGPHDIEIDPDYVPFRLTLTRPETAQEGSGAAPSRSER